MSAAFFNHLKGDLPFEAIAAGTNPASKVHPEVVEVMSEIGIDLSQAVPQKLTAELASDAGLLVTLGCGENCPYVPGLKVEDWPLNDPKGKSLDQVRIIRDELKGRVESLIDALTKAVSAEGARDQ